MNTEDAIKWLRRRTAMALFHQDRIVVVLPHHSVNVDAAREQFKLEITQGFVLAMSDKGDGLAEVVVAARDVWKERVANNIDLLSDSVGMELPPARMNFGRFDPRFNFHNLPKDHRGG